MFIGLGFSQQVKFLPPEFRGFNSRDKFEVAVIGDYGDLQQSGQRVNGFLHRSPFGGRGVITVMNVPILAEEGNIINGGFNSQDELELVIHLDRDRPHAVFDAATFQTHIEAITHLALVAAVNTFAAQEGGNVIRFDRMNQGFQEMRVNLG